MRSYTKHAQDSIADSCDYIGESTRSASVCRQDNSDPRWIGDWPLARVIPAYVQSRLAVDQHLTTQEGNRLGPGRPRRIGRVEQHHDAVRGVRLTDGLLRNRCSLILMFYHMGLYIQVFDAFGVGLDEGFTGRDLAAHEHIEYLVGFQGIINLDVKQCSGCRIHGCLP